MKSLRKGDSGNEVLELQQLLAKAGLSITPDGDFGNYTLAKVKEFQEKNGLVADGIVGKSTWAALLGLPSTILVTEAKSSFNHGISTHALRPREYYQTEHTKKTIYLHHTAGGPRPDFTIDWWKKDGKSDGTPRRVGTAFVIGRRSQKTGDRFDGVTLRCFNEKHWAHHLGLRLNHNKRLNQESIGIEICNYGYLEKIGNEYFFAGKTKIPEEEVCVLDKPWRGHLYFEKYTEKQIEETKRLILTLAHLHNIPLPDIQYTREWFDLKYDAFVGTPGLWMHCNVRYDKTDCYPMPELIDMLNTLHEASKNFVPQLESYGHEVISTRSIEAPPTPEELQNYSGDLDDVEFED